jgi:hypothetical protein
MICLRGIDTQARDLGEALHRVVVRRQQVGHLLIELSEVILDHARSNREIDWLAVPFTSEPAKRRLGGR